MKHTQIVHNSVTCLECNKTIVSHYRHDYKTCGCPNHASVDGGLDYIRIGAANMNKISSLVITTDDPFVVVRQYADRGTYGKNGDQPLHYVKICNISDDWLEAIIKYGGAGWHIDLIKKEIQYRKDNNISIKDGK